MRLSLVILLLILSCSFIRPAHNEPRLESLIFTNDMLTKGCTLCIIPKEYQSWLPANPYITSDRKFNEQITDRVFGDMVNIKSVERILYTVYEEEAEIGVFAYQFKDISDAEEAETTVLQIRYKAILRNGHIVVVIWDDGVTAKCSSRIMQLVLSGLELNNDLTPKR